jgi:Flp pilus assembly protein CpaB
VLGVLLVLVSVVVGARLLAAADRTQLVWSAARDLAPGTALQADDLVAQEVRLFSSGSQYLAAPDQFFVGYVLDRPVLSGELVPRQALVEPGPGADLRYVSVPVQPGRYPSGLERGQRVDVWATADRDAAAVAEGAAPEGSQLLLAAVPVAAPPDAGGALAAGTTEQAVVLLVDPDDVEALVSAMSAGRIDLVRVPASPQQAAEALRGAEPVAAREP